MTTRQTLGLLLLFAALRWVWVLMNPLAPGEAYVWLCSERLAPAFFDGPAGTAYVVRALEGLGLAPMLGARLFWPVLALVVGWLTWCLGLKFATRAGATWAVVLLNVLPAFNREATTVGPTLPALVCVLGGILAVRDAWEGRRVFWLWAGLALAAGMAFRYEVVLVPLGLCGAALASRRHRLPADLSGMAFCFVLMGLVSMPALFWSAHLEWIPIAGGTLRTAWELQPHLAGRVVVSFLANFSVLLGLACLVALVGMVRAARTQQRARFLFASCAPLWAWAVYSSLRGGPALDAAFLGFVPVLVFGLAESLKWCRGQVLCACVVGVALVTTAYGLWQESESRRDWPRVAALLREASRELPAGAEQGFLIAQHPLDAAVLTWYLRPTMGTVFAPESPDVSHQMGLWPSYGDFVASEHVVDEYFTEQKGINPYMGRSALYLGSDLPQTIKAAFESVTELRGIALPGREPLTIYVCLDYQTMPL